jgi:nucleoside-diphosphate-sugar epimerase
MRAFVTGGTGFIGGHVIRKLRERGDDVVALVRDPSRAAELRRLDCELAEGDLSSTDAIRAAMEHVDSVFHIGAVYKVGIKKSERPAMFDANVGGTERVLDAAMDAGVKRIVYVSTCGVFGNTRGNVVDEEYHRIDKDWLSCYDETKFRAHEVAEDRIEKGAPVVIVQPGGVYGPNDHSELGTMLEQASRGRMPFRMFADMGLMFAHVEDVADGVVRAHDKGEIGEAYVISGEKGTMGGFVDKVCELSGRRKPLFNMPSILIKASAPLGPVIGPLMGFPPNLRELIRVSDNVTYWARDDKARRELGFAPRDLETGLKDTLAAA